MLAAVAVLGIVWVATGHNRSGLTTLVIIGVLAVPTIAGRILRRRHSGGHCTEHARTISAVNDGPRSRARARYVPDQVVNQGLLRPPAHRPMGMPTWVVARSARGR
jgi:hypothetical protein